MTAGDDGDARRPPDATLASLVDAYRRHERRLFQYCLTLLGDAAAAEDATQETFVRARDHLDRLTGEPLAAYLTVVARNVCRSEFQRQQRHQRRLSRLHHVGYTLDPAGAAIDRAVVAQAWDGMTQRDRALFLYRFAGYTHREIAGRLRTTAGAIRIELMRARRRARHLLDLEAAMLLAAARRVRVRIGHARDRRPTGRRLTTSAPRLPLRLAIVTGALGIAAWSLIPAAGDLLGGSTAAAGAPVSVALARPRVTGQMGGASADLGDIQVTDLTPGPQQHGGAWTILASGFHAGCAPACPALLRSDDGGHTWRTLRGAGFAGGRVLVTPGFPVDPTLFATGPAGLQRSDDGGASFRTVVDVIGPAQVSPRSRPGDARVVIGGTSLVTYSARSGTVTRATALTTAGSASRVDSIAVEPDGAHVLLTLQGRGAVVRCTLDGDCTQVASNPGASFMHLAASATDAVDGAVIAYSRDQAYLWRDATHELVPLDALRGMALHSMALATDGGGRLRVVASVSDNAGRRAAVWQSIDGGRRFAPLPGHGVAPVLSTVITGGDGRVLGGVAAPDDSAAWGIRCTMRGGLIGWTPSC